MAVSAISREDIYKKLFQTVSDATFASPISGVTQFQAPLRKMVMPDQVPVDTQPTLHQYEGVAERYDWSNLAGPKRIIGASLFCWARVASGDPSEIGSTYLTLMLEAIEQVLIPDDPAQGVNTLGGIVYWCRIEGKILKVPGDLDPQALLVVPIRMEIP